MKRIAVKVGEPINPYVNEKKMRKLKKTAEITIQSYKDLNSSANAETLKVQDF
jgi:hypothetical protein